MKAARIAEYGDASVITIENIDKPTIKAGQVVVQVKAASINPFDGAIRSGYMKDAIPLELPVTLGGDIAGVITEVAGDVTNFTVGDTVYGQANVVAGNSGAFAEFAATSAGQVAKAPGNVNFEEAASLPLVGVSALQALTEHMQVQKGQKIFITGGSGGIGTIAIQIAKNIGAYVATTATGDGLQAAKQLGADKVLDYKNQDFGELLADYDGVFDTVGGEGFDKILHILKKGGVAVSMIAPANERLAKELGVSAQMQSTHVSTDRLNALTKLIESGVVKPQVGKVFRIDDITEAFKAKETGDVVGKIVLTVE